MITLSQIQNIPPKTGLLLKVAATIAICLLFAFTIPLKDSLAILGSADPLICAAAIMIFLIQNIPAGFRWKVLLSSRSRELSVARLTGTYLKANFYGQLLPTAVGGDLYRVASIKDSVPVMEATGSVFVERFLGLISLLSICLISSGFIHGDNTAALNTATAFIFASLTSIAVLISFSSFATRFENVPVIGSLIGIFMSFRRELLSYRSVQVIALAFAASFLYQFMGIFAAWLCSAALGVDMGLAIVAYSIPLALIASLLPISLNGVGVREGVLVFFISASGIPRESAAAFALLLLVIRLLSALIGGTAVIFSSHAR